MPAGRVTGDAGQNDLINDSGDSYDLPCRFVFSLKLSCNCNSGEASQVVQHWFCEKRSVRRHGANAMLKYARTEGTTQLKLKPGRRRWSVHVAWLLLSQMQKMQH